MPIEKANALDANKAGVILNLPMQESAHAGGKYHVKCHDEDGNLLWEANIDNLVTTVGKNNALDNHLSGSGYTAAWYMGLISSTGYSAINAADTMGSHAGWTEDTGYSQANRVTAAFSAAASGSKSLSSALTFSINASTTIKGCFLTTVNTKGGTTGTLYSAGLFTEGDQVVSSGNTLSVSYTASL